MGLALVPLGLDVFANQRICRKVLGHHAVLRGELSYTTKQRPMLAKWPTVLCCYCTKTLVDPKGWNNRK